MAVISCPSSKPCFTNSVPVAPVAPKTTSLSCSPEMLIFLVWKNTTKQNIENYHLKYIARSQVVGGFTLGLPQWGLLIDIIIYGFIVSWITRVYRFTICQGLLDTRG